MKNFLLFLEIFRMVKPLLQEAVIAVKAVNVMKRTTKQQLTGSRFEQKINDFFSDHAQANKAIASVYDHIRSVAGDSECLKKEQTIDVIACYLHGIAYKPKQEQRMLWRELARVILKHRNPDNQWDDSLVDTAIQVGYATTKISE